jgi:hypothetical protein
MAWKTSASSISAFKACPTRFRLAYVERLRPAQDTEAQRMGTNWHACLEVATQEGLSQEQALDAVVDLLNEKYATVPPGIDPTDWAIEREVLANSVAGWLWWYQDDQVTTTATELPFELPIRNPANGRALPGARYIGKIDRTVRRRQQNMIGEYKSTSRPIGSDSSYWNRLNLDTQVSVYCLAARQGIGDVAGVLYDVWHRPTIRPRKLTQADSAEFVKTGLYCGREFLIHHARHASSGGIQVDGVAAEIEPGKKEGSFALRETPEMFGARLLQDITERPEFYFARREIARTDTDLEDFSWELLHIYQSMRAMERSGHWFRNESQCEATFRCQYASICFHRQNVCDGQTTPDGFVRLDKTPEKPVEEQE